MPEYVWIYDNRQGYEFVIFCKWFTQFYKAEHINDREPKKYKIIQYHKNKTLPILIITKAKSKWEKKREQGHSTS